MRVVVHVSLGSNVLSITIARTPMLKRNELRLYWSSGRVIVRVNRDRMGLHLRIITSLQFLLERKGYCVPPIERWVRSLVELRTRGPHFPRVDTSRTSIRSWMEFVTRELSFHRRHSKRMFQRSSLFLRLWCFHHGLAFPSATTLLADTCGLSSPDKTVLGADFVHGHGWVGLKWRVGLGWWRPVVL